MFPPSRAAVLQRIEALAAGVLTRNEATDRAMQWVGAREPGVDDRSVWDALNSLAGANTPSTDREYLFERIDFEAWRETLETAP